MKHRIVALLIAAGFAAALGGALPTDAGARDRDRDRDRGDRQHAPRVEKRHHRPSVVIREGAHHDRGPRVVVRRDRWCPPPPPRVVIRRDTWCPPPRIVVHRPWYAGARTVFVDNEPFYFHAGFGIFLGGLGLHIDIGDGLPPGCAYYDPYCGELFYSLEPYDRHLRRHGHPAALSVIDLDEGW